MPATPPGSHSHSVHLSSYPRSSVAILAPGFGSEELYDSEGIHSHRDSHGLSCGKQCGQCPDLYIQPGSPEPAQPTTGHTRSYHVSPTDRVHLSLCEGFSQTLKQCKYNHDLSFSPKELWALLHIPPISH